MIMKNNPQCAEPTMGKMNCSFPLFIAEIRKRRKSILIQNLLLSSSTFYALCAVTLALKPVKLVYRSIIPRASMITRANQFRSQRRDKSQTQGDVVLQSELGFFNHSVLFLRGKFYHLFLCFSPLLTQSKRV